MRKLTRLKRRLRRKLWSLLLVAPLLGAWYAAEVLVFRPPLNYEGIPRAVSWNPLTWTHVLRNDGFLVGYSELRGNPLWVMYKLTPIAQNSPYYKRPQRFSEDWRNLTRIGHDDYTGSGYDRGHLAPNYAISRLYGREGQLDTFLMTNITPQKPKLNQKLWQRLEEVEIDHYARRLGTLWVITGPIFDKDIERLRSSLRVEIPDAFFRIWAQPADEKQRQPKLLAFIVPQNVRGNEPLTRFAVSVDEVERRTGLDFFYDLPDGVENRLEAGSASQAWNLQAVARRPPRY